MKVLTGLVGVGAVIAAVLPLSSKVLAADASLPVKAPQTVGGVIYYGEIEVGGIGFIDRPPNTIRTTTIVPGAQPFITGYPTTWSYTTPESRAKFEEYGNINPGFWFDHLKFGAATTDGRYYGDFSAKHIGNNDQSYSLELGETGRQYLTLEWDQIPHLYSTTAQSIFGGTPTFLIAPVDPGFTAANACNGALGPVGANLSAIQAANAQRCSDTINKYLHTINLGIQRDKGTIEYRSTPSDAWEFNVAYSHEHRYGTQENGITSVTGTPAAPTVGTNATAMAVPTPINDTTQDARAGLQYTGTSPWGMRFTTNAQYAASFYNNNYALFDIENPFVPYTIGGLANNPGSLNQFSLAPSNNAQSFTGTVGADLPWKSRYMGTFAYTMMRQDDPFMSPLAPGLAPIGGAAFLAASAPSRGSLDGKIDTMLFNNVLTTQLTPDLKSKLSYRYYSFENNTPYLLQPVWIANDSAPCNVAGTSYCPHATQFENYIKQNAGADLTWRANSWLTTGIGYGWEHYNYTQADVSATNQNSGKVFADAKPTDWFNVRSSYEYSSRRYENYNFLNNVWAQITNWSLPTGATPLPLGCGTGVQTTGALPGACAAVGGIQQNNLMRMFDLANRDRQKAKVLIDFEVAPGIVITPTFGMQLDRYPNAPGAIYNTAVPVPGVIGMVNTIGTRANNNYNLGADLAMAVNSSTQLVITYLHETVFNTMYSATGQQRLLPNGTVGSPAGMNAISNYDTFATNDYIDTVTAALNVELTPKVLDLKLGYTFMHANETGGGVYCLINCGAPSATQASTTALANAIPDAKTTYQLFEGTLKYKFNQDQLRSMGWTGQGYAKIRYVYEMNHVNNWQSNSMMPYMYAVLPTQTGGGNKIWMAGDNPNYNAQLIMATLGLSW